MKKSTPISMILLVLRITSLQIVTQLLVIATQDDQEASALFC